MKCELQAYVTPREMADVYHETINRIKEIHEELELLNEKISKAFDGNTFGFCLDSDQIRSSRYDRKIGALLRNAKRKAWATILGKMGIEAYMSVTEREKFSSALHYESRWDEDPNDPVHQLPEITVENIEAIFNGYVSSLDDMVTAKAEEIYKFLKPYASDEHKTNVQNRWRIGQKVILEYGVSEGYGKNPFRISESKDARLHSMDTLFHLLDGKGVPRTHRGPIHEAVHSIQRSGQAVETEYFRLKAFKNRKLHIEFKRMDLVQDINLMCGNKSELPDQRKEARYQGQAAEIDTSKFADLDLNFFETPAPIVDLLIHSVGLKQSDRVLEPSAGRGAIANTAAKVCGSGIQVVEIDPSRSDELHRQGHNVIVADFLSVKPVQEYDVVLMNPPFSHQRDIVHIEHAIKFLATGGRLAAIASSGVMFRGDKRSVGFRELIHSMGGQIRKLPSGAFSVSGTEVETVLVVINR